MQILVTGCGGFLGSEIVRQLLRRGDHVVGVSRQSYADLEALGMTHRRGDLCNASFTQNALVDVDAVIHTAAVAGVWGPWQRYYRINTLATEHVIDACRQNKIPSLVYTSSPSVTFDGSDQCGIDEAVPYPPKWMCHYPHTKALAEQAVLKAHEPGRFSTCALRPHLIWGADDPHLLARVVDRARSGKLRIVGDGQNLIDTVHVSDAAASHLYALDALGKSPETAGGQAYFVTQDEPVNCWDWIGQICETAGVAKPTKRIGFSTAYRMGALLETAYRWMGRKEEPPMTRFVAAQLARHHYFDISAAKQRLGYTPKQTMAERLAELRDRWSSKHA
ncbi:NAD-dependent epimerase/dehydratase family protein [Stieleria varia]|uniref:3 beta-hydroxysteroid dehydrogenase/Delta 5-->4-isomerase n=1 Tax=Stieleria varia TaxID=2528005 RepID=A0A5C6BAS7_9BACT|nr:NAD-dependent epimerase/dehydratase family protein [Stieleria varia]TWU08541.1 3 beta-hydroxysteroid dehydrogenase/Delta 5-->4-isomerase [Stieleria varia]